MLKNLIILPDGTEIFSGNSRENSIISCKYTQCVNDSTELSIGSCCCNELELKLFAKDGLSIAANDEIQYYKVDNSGARTKIGVFRCEKPTVTGTGTYKFVAYDNVSKLDKDLTEWLAALDGWPYTVSTFARMVCEACGLELAETPIDYSFNIVSGHLILTYNGDEPQYSIDENGNLVLGYSGAYPDVSIDSNGNLVDESGGDPLELINGDYSIRKFTGSGITGRMLMQWLGQIACRFVRANADGEIEFAWYTDRGTEITTNGDLRFFGGSLSYEDFQVAEVQKVQIQASDEDNGTVYPDGNEEELNTYKITGNYLLTAETGDELKPVAKAIFEQLQGVTYTPCRVSIQATTAINAGDIVHVTDRNGVTITTYVMSKTNSGQKDTLECTGSYKRDSSTATNDIGLKALNGKVLNIEKSVDGLRIQNKDTAGKLSELSMTVDELSTRVTDEVNGLQSEITQTANELSIEITAVSKTSDEALRAAKANANDLSSFSDSVTGSLADLQGQIDGAIETWFYSYVPTSSNYPASSWTTADEQNKHLGDLFYIVDNDEKGGQVYRWALVNGVYSWVVVEDTEVAKALEIASKAQDTADGKRRVFVTTPVPPYDVGDLWSNGTDLYVCQTSRQTGSYSSADWKLATAYTTDAVVTSKIEQLNDSITLKVTSVESKASAAQNTADKAVSDAAGAQSTANTAVSRVSSLAVTVDGIDARVSTSEGNYTSLKQSVSDLAVTVSDADGRITAISATIDGLTIKDSSGTTKISGSSVETSSMLLTGSININDNFLVDSLGNVQLNGNVTWGTGTSPTQVLYASSALTKPTNGTSWSSFPASGTGWHQSFLSSDYYASYTYDGGATWTDAVQVRGINGADGTDGKDGRDGSDAYVDAQNVFNALTSGGTLYGCFSGSSANALYINASYIRTGILSFGDGSYYIAPYATADYLKLPGLTITSSGAAFSGSVTAVSGQIGNFTISGGYLSYSDSGGTRSQLSPNGTFLFSPTSAGYVQFNYSYANSRYELALGSAAALTIGAYSLTADNLRALLKLI